MTGVRKTSEPAVVERHCRVQTAVIFDTLLGDDLPARKEFITKYGQKYLNDLDIDED